MSDAKRNDATDAEETYDKIISARVPSELAERVETLSDRDFSEEVRAGLRLRRIELEEEHNQLRTDGGKDVGRDERRSLIPVATKAYEVHDAAADVAHDAVEHGDLAPGQVASALRDAADEVERTDVEEIDEELATDGGLQMGATHTGPHTSPPTARFGQVLDRYSQYLAARCPECGEIGIDVWIHEGATVARGVCVACDATLDEDDLDAARGEDA